MEWALLGDGQLEWIKTQLSEAKSKKQLVCMFGHIPLTKNIHSSKCILWDSEKLQHLLKENGQHTAAYIAGKKWYFEPRISRSNTPGPHLMRIHLVRYSTSARYEKYSIIHLV